MWPVHTKSNPQSSGQQGDDPCRTCANHQEPCEQVVTLEGSEQDEAAEDLVDQRELELARAENEFLAWDEVKADLGLA
jgi:hypothetical protein